MTRFGKFMDFIGPGLVGIAALSLPVGCCVLEGYNSSSYAKEQQARFDDCYSQMTTDVEDYLASVDEPLRGLLADEWDSMNVRMYGYDTSARWACDRARNTAINIMGGAGGES